MTRSTDTKVTSRKLFRPYDPWRPSPLRELERTSVLKTYYYDIEVAQFQDKTGQTFSRHIIRENNGDTLAISAITEDGYIALVEQYRLAQNMWTLEIPAGHAFQGEAPMDAAKRRLREEAGLVAQSLDEIIRFVNTPSFSTQHTIIYHASGLTDSTASGIGPDSPSVYTRFIPLEEAYAMTLNGTIVDAKTIIAVSNEYARLHE